MSNDLIQQDNHEVIQKLVLSGDIGSMSPQQKVSYYKSFCESLGLNPLTQPFQIIKFQGKEKLYATKDCTEQLRKIHGVSITDVTAQELRGVYVVTAKAKDKTGKTDAATGVVNIEGLKGENLANALMKAETKAKRRVTLSICGLGILDESEMDTMPPHERGTIETEIEDVPTKEERLLLKSLVNNSDLNEDEKEKAFEAIDTCTNYKKFQAIQYRLEARQLAIDQIQNPSAKDINNHLKKVTA